MDLASDKKEQQKYGVLSYSSINIGDEIQSIAAMRFLPQIDYYIPRERTDEFHSENSESVKMIMNAWWMWDKEHFPPSKDIDPLFISFFLRHRIRDDFMTNKVIDYFKQHEPIGCRDASTAKFMQEKGIDAYFSGCLTMTLLPNEKLKEKGGDYILCVDVPEKMLKVIKKRAKKPVYDVTRMMSPAFTSKNRLELAKFMLYIYHNAYCVITPRLHVALPCTAFGTPVCVLTTEKWKHEVLTRRGRFDGMEHIFNEVLIEKYMKRQRKLITGTLTILNIMIITRGH